MIQVDIDKESREIINKYRKLLRKAKPLLKDGDSKKIRHAFNIAAKAHQNVRRKSNEPYIYHPLEVAYICVNEIGMGTTSIICALLHDVVEDTECTVDEIKSEFGDKIAQIIDGLTKISGVFDRGSSQQAENFRKMLLTLSDDVRVILIKLADRLHNMRTLDSMPIDKQYKIASETIFLYAPLAHRLGLYAIKSEMEDLYLKYTQNKIFIELVNKIDAKKTERERFIKNFIKPLNSELKNLNFNYELKGRPKSIYSIYNKMKKQDISFEEIYDLFAIRIILDVKMEEEKSASWKVYSIVTDHYKPNPDRLRDWISTPKANGYESLHTTVMANNGKWVEVQIRTKRMDEIAEKGYAAHWKYKENKSKSNGLDIWISKVRDMLEQSNTSALEFVDDFRGNLFQEEVFVFTPTGELKTLPSGASALDFAYEIHTEIGSKCIGAKVNKKLMPISYILKNGDQIEILTTNKQKPNKDWLNFVVTSKAKSNIKEKLKDKNKQAITEGKEIITRKFKQYKIELNNSTMDRFRSYLKFNSATELYIHASKGLLDNTHFKGFKSHISAPIIKPKTTIRNNEDSNSSKEIIKNSKENYLFIGEDLDIIDYTLSKCCNPIPGDSVFGYVTTMEGIKIHRITCPNAPQLLANYSHRVIKAKWSSEHSSSFLVDINVIGTDRVGLINDITKIISNELEVNMNSISINSNSGIFQGDIEIYVHDTLHLNLLLSKLKAVEGVLKVTRHDSN